MTDMSGKTPIEDIYALARLHIIRTNKNETWQAMLREYYNMRADLEQVQQFIQMLQDQKEDLEDKVLELNSRNKKLEEEKEEIAASHAKLEEENQWLKNGSQLAATGDAGQYTISTTIANGSLTLDNGD